MSPKTPLISPKKNLLITGIRGIPATHGGFETFAEHLACYLTANGWNVTVYCQESRSQHKNWSESQWCGIKRIHIPVTGNDSKASILFDYHSIRHASTHEGLILTLGYNTALFNILPRMRGKKMLINMDGIEWKRNKWKWYEKAWLYLNEKVGKWVGHHLIADHPEIKKHLASGSENYISMIPYGAREVTHASLKEIAGFPVKPYQYAIVIARPEPENSILEIVRAFSKKPRGKKLLILGKYKKSHDYQNQVIQAASTEVHFIGSVYQHSTVDALRFYSCLYIHGHTVGGSNPSLIEALGAGQPILAHDNKFNRWVGGEKSTYFYTEMECDQQLEQLLNNKEKQNKMSQFSREQFKLKFTWPNILNQYEKLLLKWI